MDFGSPRDIDQEVAMGAFKVIVGADKFMQHAFVLENHAVKLFTSAKFLRHMDIPCVAAADVRNNKFVVFTEKDKAPIVKYALKTPFEELVQNALDKNVISKKMAVSLLGDERISNFPIKEFVQTCAEYISEIAQKKVEWKTTRQRIEGETEWLEEIR